MSVAAVPAAGHQARVSYATLEIGEPGVSLEISVPIDELSGHQAGVGPAASEGVAFGEVEAMSSEGLARLIIGFAAIESMGAAVPLELTGPAAERRDGRVLVRARATLPPEAASLAYHFAIERAFGAEHVQFVQARRGQAVQQWVLAAGDDVATIQLRPGSGGRRVRDFVWLGAKHVLTGYDHLLFLLALIVTSTSLKGLVKIVTSFTVAHSITLSLAVLQWVELPARGVEVAIALSIVYVAVENLLREKPGDRWVLTFLFGLIHGFGFANLLTEQNLPASGLIASLFSFNLGVELGQLLVVLCLLPAVALLDRSSRRGLLVRTVSVIVLCFGAGWFLERLLDSPGLGLIR